MKYIVLGMVLSVAIVALSMTIDMQSRASHLPSPSERGPGGEGGRRLICASGRIEGATPEIKLRPQVAGRVAKLCVKEGQFARAGQVLLELDDAQQVQEVAEADAELHLAETQLQRLVHGAEATQRAEAAALYRAKLAELERAQLTRRRIDDLLRKQSATGQESDNQRTLVDALAAAAEAAKAHLQWLDSPTRPDEVQIATARVQVAHAHWKLAQTELDRMRLRSPLGGQVLKIGIETGEMAGPASPDSAVIIADTSRCRVRAFVDEIDAAEVRAGMAATVTAESLRGEELRGRVVRVSPRMSEKGLWNDRPEERLDTKTREVWIELDDRPSLVVGLRVDVVIDPRSETLKR